MIVSEQPSTQRQRAKLCLSKRVFYIFVCFLIIVFGILPVVVEVVWGLICAQVARFQTMLARYGSYASVVRPEQGQAVSNQVPVHGQIFPYAR